MNNFSNIVTSYLNKTLANAKKPKILIALQYSPKKVNKYLEEILTELKLCRVSLCWHKLEMKHVLRL